MHVSRSAPSLRQRPTHSPHRMHSAERVRPLRRCIPTLLLCMGQALLHCEQYAHRPASFLMAMGLNRFIRPSTVPTGQKLHQNLTRNGAVTTSTNTRNHPGSMP